MTTTVEAPTLDLTVGTPITSREQMVALPVGATVRFTTNGTIYTKREDGRWDSDRLTNGGPYTEDNHFILNGSNVVHSLPTPAPAYVVGQSVATLEELEGLPFGAVIVTSSGRTTYTRIADGFQSSNGNARTVAWLANRVSNPLSIQSLPTPLPPVDTTVETVADTSVLTEFPVETLARFKQRFKTVVLGAQQSAGVSRSAVEGALHKLGVEEVEPCIGMEVCLSDETLIESIPQGAVMIVGEDPSKYHDYGVFGVTSSGYIRLVGGYNEDGHDLCRIVSIPDQTEAAEWVTAPPSETEAQDIRTFMAEAWRVGGKAKSEQGWCGEYESAMRRVGIDENIAMAALPTLTAEQVAELPEGTILRVRTITGQTVLYRRDNAADNPAKTRRVGGVLEGSWSKDGMAVVFNPETDTEMRIPVASREEMATMPVGTVVQDGRARWERRADMYQGNPQRVWYSRGESYGYQASQFNASSIHYAVIPR